MNLNALNRKFEVSTFRIYKVSINSRIFSLNVHLFLLNTLYFSLRFLTCKNENMRYWSCKWWFLKHFNKIIRRDRNSKIINLVGNLSFHFVLQLCRFGNLHRFVQICAPFECKMIMKKLWTKAKNFDSLYKWFYKRTIMELLSAKHFARV